VRRARWGPRVLDLDLLLYDALSLEEEDLVVPHKRLVERAFVLVPLSEVSPEVVVPGTGGRTVRSLLSDLERSEGDVSRVGDPPAPDDD
jgi:2-amino-4-hydroxy-6-hydroxymethyldihydropteridine diphosphokinase